MHRFEVWAPRPGGSSGSIRVASNLSEAAVPVSVCGPVLAASPGVSGDGDRTTLAVDSVVIWSQPR